MWRRARKKRPGRGPLVRHHPPNQGGVTATGAVPGFTSGEVVVDPLSKKVLVQAIREAKPRSRITQDPDRHHAMLLILEGVALAAREYSVEELGSLAPHPVPTLYDTTPHHPNCIVGMLPTSGILRKRPWTSLKAS